MSNQQPKKFYEQVTKYIKPLKGLIYGPTHCGKTYGSLIIAHAIIKAQRQCTDEEAWKRILLLDSEYGRGTMHQHLGPYNYKEIEAPYNPQKLIDYIIAANDDDDIDVIITDSLTHYWSKKGGILDLKSAADAQGGNSYTNWNTFTMLYNELLDTILSSPKHIIATARAKTDTVMVENAKGKLEPKIYGLKPEARDGIDYEFDFTFNIDKATHGVYVEKALTGMDLFYERITPEFGQLLYTLHTQNAKQKLRDAQDIINNIRNVSKNSNLIQFVQLQLSGRKLDDLDMDTLVQLEKSLLTEVRKKQAKR